MQSWVNKYRWWLLAGFGLSLVYLATHFWNLTGLPVFADEAIYIRWSQLIIDDWKQYLFFPLNDGKTPLFMWLMVPWQFVFSDQLWAARFVSVILGLVQVVVIGLILRAVKARPKTILAGMVLTTILPFWFFHHRMALIDSLLTLCISLSYLAAIKAVSLPVNAETKWRRWLWMGLMGAAFGGALWTKVPAILAAPALGAVVLLPRNLTLKQRAWLALELGVGTIMGIVIFVLLKLNPAFSQLFGRGSDFLYPWKDVILHGAWKNTLPNIPTYISYFGSYLTWPIIIGVPLSIFTYFSPKYHRLQLILALGVIGFAGPIALLGRVVYPRYFLPVAIFFTLSAALFLEELVVKYVQNTKNMMAKTAASVVLALIVVNVISISARFMVPALIAPNAIPFVSADKVQYLHEWSSGHGITEAVAYINQVSVDHTVAVGTEGRFGTLPDGLLLYFHRRPVDNLYVEGLGYPVKGIPNFFLKRAKTFDQSLLLVNSHRMELNLPKEKLLKEYCRPHNAPCLQIWDITDLVKDTPLQAENTTP